jgi:hypothetical protein
MIKKIVLLSLMFITGLGCVAQDHVYVSPVFNTRFDFGVNYNVYDITVDFQHYKEIGERSWSKFTYGIGCRVANKDFGPIISMSYGVGIDFDNFYGLLDFRPIFKSTTTDIVFGVITKLGVGYNFKLTDSSVLFIESGLFKEFDVIYTSDKLDIDSFGIYLNIGFKFKHI